MFGESVAGVCWMRAVSSLQSVPLGRSRALWRRPTRQWVGIRRCLQSSDPGAAALPSRGPRESTQRQSQTACCGRSRDHNEALQNHFRKFREYADDDEDLPLPAPPPLPPLPVLLQGPPPTYVPGSLPVISQSCPFLDHIPVFYGYTDLVRSRTLPRASCLLNGPSLRSMEARRPRHPPVSGRDHQTLGCGADVFRGTCPMTPAASGQAVARVFLPCVF